MLIQCGQQLGAVAGDEAVGLGPLPVLLQTLLQLLRRLAHIHTGHRLVRVVFTHLCLDTRVVFGFIGKPENVDAVRPLVAWPEHSPDREHRVAQPTQLVNEVFGVTEQR
jgi:hypothetical protein